MATVDVSSLPITSFIYEDFIAKIQTVQQQMIEMENLLQNRCKTDKKIQNQLKSRSIIFIDHLGYRTIHKCLDHEQLNQVLKNYKKNYIPKYLQKWIQFGVMIDNSISSLTDLQLKSMVSNFENGQEVHCYGEINVWIGTSKNDWPRKIVVPVCLSDNMEKVTMEIRKQRRLIDIEEWRSSMVDGNGKPPGKSWSEGTPLKSDDTVLSLQLFQSNSIILGKLINREVKHHFFDGIYGRTFF